MLTVILAAGDSRRFAEAGFPLPKPLLPMPKGGTLLEGLVNALAPVELVFVAQYAHREQFLSVTQKIKKMHEELHIFIPVYLKEKTKGPLDTVWAARKWLFWKQGFDTEVLFAYCDCLPTHEWLSAFLEKARTAEACVAGMDSDDPRFTNIPGTNLKCGGIFWFKSIQKLLRIAGITMRKPEVGLPHVVYAHNWTYYPASMNELTDLGVPQDYRNYYSKHGKPLPEW